MPAVGILLCTHVILLQPHLRPNSINLQITLKRTSVPISVCHPILFQSEGPLAHLLSHTGPTPNKPQNPPRGLSEEV